MPNTNNREAFSLANYQALVETLIEQGYKVRDFDQVEPEQRHLILRHDVDMSPEAAVTLAELEQGIGVCAVYFVLLRGELYNAISESNLRSLNRIAALGHEIGLHLDASLYDNDLARLDEAAQHECQILESALNQQIKTISFHRPAKAILNCQQPLAGRLHAYQTRFFEEVGYCSDSRGGWFHGHPLEHRAVRAGRALQLLTHPIWWVATISGTPTETLERFVQRHLRTFEQNLADNCEPYRSVLDRKLSDSD